MERKCLGLKLVDVMSLSYQRAVRHGIKNKYCARNGKNVRKCLKNFLLLHQEISVTNTDILPAQEQVLSLLNQ